MSRVRRVGAMLLALAAILGIVGFAVVGTQGRAAALGNGLAQTPPMGWNGYNHFARNVSASTVEAEARTMVAAGMKAAGFTYVNLDGGWNLLQRDAQGNLQPNPALFPDGIKPVADYVHSLGLKFGIYTSAGTVNCAGSSAGSYGHYQQDADTFAAWGVDYLKLDWCYVPYQYYPNMTHTQVSQMLATQMSDALVATGRPIIYDVNDTALQDQDWTWGSGVANLWRTAPDISDSYSSLVGNFSDNVQHYAYAGPGGWNDPDMLEVGNGGMTTTEDQSQFSLWAEMAAPLIAGNDLTTMSVATKVILTNTDVIAVDQDPLGKQGYPVASSGGHWVLTKPLANGDRAVVLFNQTDTPATISTTATQVGVGSAPAYTLRDLWTHTTTETAGTITATVPPHGVVMYRLARSPSAPGSYPPQTSLGVSVASSWLGVGQSTTVTGSFTNDGRLAVSDVTLSLQAPSGWTAAVTSPTTFGSVPGGHSVTATWQVTASATPTAPISTATLNAMASYVWGDNATRGSASASVNLDETSPVQAPYQTFASTEAHFGQLGNQFGIDAAGSDDWISVDQAGTIYLPGGAGPNTVAQVEITSQQDTSPYAKAGLMVRNDITGAGQSPGYVILFVSPSHGFELEWDNNGGGYIDTGTPLGGTPTTTTYPSWVRLVKNGSTFTGYWSTNGTTWNLVGTATVPDAAATQDVGIFSTSHSTGVLGLSTFNNFTVNPATP